VNSVMTFTAAVMGGVNVRYQFWLYNAAANPAWSQLQGYTTQNACTWIPVTAGNYLLAVTAQDGASGVTVNTTLWYTIIDPLTSLHVNVSQPVWVNYPTTITATAEGGANDQFQFWLYDPANTPAWIELQAYSTKNICTWTPAAAGSYLLSVTVKDGSSGKTLNAVIWETVSAGNPLAAVSVTAAPASPQAPAIPIILTAAATGGANVQYQFWLYNTATTPAWSKLQAYSSQNSYTWTPSTAGNYLLSVTAWDGVTGIEVNTMVWYTVE